MLDHDGDSGASLDEAVLTALPVGVDLDLAQVASLAKVMPWEAQASIQRLLAAGEIESDPEADVAGRSRYRRLNKTA